MHSTTKLHDAVAIVNRREQLSNDHLLPSHVLKSVTFTPEEWSVANVVVIKMVIDANRCGFHTRAAASLVALSNAPP